MLNGLDAFDGINLRQIGHLAVGICTTRRHITHGAFDSKARSVIWPTLSRPYLMLHVAMHLLAAVHGRSRCRNRASTTRSGQEPSQQAVAQGMLGR